ncbi:MAG: amidophosphoribosyltransferase, partial [Flavobacteriales bacterium]|nr:amidophosphoribosyltransferase [Flavobacteriales bacterium]
RGTTLQQSIVRIMDRLRPKHLIILSSAPQVRYPDCYGIDMASMQEFIAFRAAIELLKENGMESVIDDVYRKCKAQESLEDAQMVNYVKEIYAPFTDEQIADKIAQMITSEDTHARISVIFQTLDGLHDACPNHLGDWYFSGDYPTVGGNRMVNNAFIAYMEGKSSK